jgi:hypothetical protein
MGKGVDPINGLDVSEKKVFLSPAENGKPNRPSRTLLTLKHSVRAEFGHSER